LILSQRCMRSSEMYSALTTRMAPILTERPNCQGLRAPGPFRGPLIRRNGDSAGCSSSACLEPLTTDSEEARIDRSRRRPFSAVHQHGLHSRLQAAWSRARAEV
jgi:hypothetical protein